MKHLLILVFSMLIFSCSFGQNNQEIPVQDSLSAAKITFIELGSVNCIPCKQMVPVMKSVEEKYGSQLEVIFYDVWKEDQKKYAEKYNVNIIPTQVFLNANGEEINRHVGFFPESKIDEFLQANGLTILNTNN